MVDVSHSFIFAVLSRRWAIGLAGLKRNDEADMDGWAPCRDCVRLLIESCRLFDNFYFKIFPAKKLRIYCWVVCDGQNRTGWLEIYKKIPKSADKAGIPVCKPEDYINFSPTVAF